MNNYRNFTALKRATSVIIPAAVALLTILLLSYSQSARAGWSDGAVSGQKIVIVGAGASGLSAGWWLARRRAQQPWRNWTIEQADDLGELLSHLCWQGYVYTTLGMAAQALAAPALAPGAAIRRLGLRALHWCAGHGWRDGRGRAVRSWIAAWPQIEALGFDAAFRRLWTYYLCYCEAGFTEEAIDVGFFVLKREEEG